MKSKRKKTLRTHSGLAAIWPAFLFGGSLPVDVPIRDAGRRMMDRFDQIRWLLRRQTTLVLASSDEGAMPRATPLFFVADSGLRLYWFSSRASWHSRNCVRHPLSAITIFRDARRWQQIEGVQMEGFVAVVTDRALRRVVTHDYGARFALDKSFAGVIQRSSLYCFTPEWIRHISNAHRFGEKFELNLRSKSR